jgi:hypothetical protein
MEYYASIDVSLESASPVRCGRDSAQRSGERVMARHGVLLAANRPGMACRRRL